MSDPVTPSPKKNNKRARTPPTIILSSKKSNDTENLIRLKLNQEESIQMSKTCLVEKTNHTFINHQKPYGCGMSGCVYEVKDQITGTIRIAKINAFVREREIQIQNICSKNLIAPNLNQIIECEAKGINIKSVICIIMEKFDMTLQDYVTKGYKITGEMAYKFINLCTKMASLKIMHNDMKPDNVVISLNSNNEVFAMRIIDFGRSCLNLSNEPFKYKEGWMRSTIPSTYNNGIKPYIMEKFDPYWDIFNMYVYISKHYNNEHEKPLVYDFRDILIKELQKSNVLQGLYIYNGFDFTSRLGKQWIKLKNTK